MPHYIDLVLLYGAAGVLVLLLALKVVIPLFLVVYVAPVPPPVRGTIRIACVGDSITYGTMVKGRRANCYPAQLESLLGNEFSVRNFGANGRAVQRVADLSYWRHKYFRLSSEFNPDIVLIMLGTNDSRKPNWKGSDRYLQDYRDLVMHYRSLPSRPVVYALTPPTQFKLKNKTAIKYGMLKEAVDEMTAGIRGLSRELDIEVIDINAATASHPEHFSFDGIHANGRGARHIAEIVYTRVNAGGRGHRLQPAEY
jgi:lysophospholipase L1-like esterase